MPALATGSGFASGTVAVPPPSLPAGFTPQKVADTVQNSFNAGNDWSFTTGLLSQFGISEQQAVQSLAAAGWSPSKINQYTRNPSLLQKILAQASASTAIGPLGTVGEALAGGGGATAAEGAAAGAAGASVAGASSGLLGQATAGLAGAAVLSGIWQWLTTSSNWVRVLEYVGGAVLIYLGIKGLAGI